MPAELIAPALACGQHRRLDARVDDRGRRRRARRVRGRSRSAAGRVQPRHRARLGRRRRDRAQPRHARRRLHRLDRDRAARSPRPRPARRRCSSSAATGRSSCSRTPTSTLAAEAAVTACFLCAGQSCTAGERLLVHRDVREEFVARLAALVAERVVLGDPFADGTTMGPLNNAGVAEKMDEHVARRARRAARTLVHGGARADGFPTDLYWQPTVLDGVPARRARRARRRRSGRSRRSSRSTRSTGDRADERLAVRAAVGDLHARPREGAALRRRGAHRLGEHQRLVELLGGAPAVRRPRRHRERDRACRRQRRRWSRSPSCRPSSSRELRLRDRRRRLCRLRARRRG